MSHQPNNSFAGTQVVSLVEVRGTNNALVHPRGAVGVVTRTPAVAGEKFLVRFPDGFEAPLTRNQLEVLKHFKDRLGAPGTDPARPDLVGRASSRAEDGKPDSGFDLEQFIIYRCVVGSRAYGLDNDESDTDRRGIYLAPAELQWSLFGAPEQFEDNATQSCYWELQKFLTMALKANPNILECLYSPMVEKVTPLGEELLATRFDRQTGRIVSVDRHILSAFEEGEEDELGELPDWQKEELEIAKAMAGDDGERFIDAPDKFDFHEYRHMERFIGTVENAQAAEELWRAIKGKGAFRYFKDTARRLGLLDQWYRYRDAAVKEYVLDWAEANQVTVEDDTKTS